MDEVATEFVLRQRRSAFEPGQINGAVAARGLARQDIAPGFERSLGLLDVFEKCLLAVKATPAPAVEQFCEIFEPLFGEIAPARDNFAASSNVELRCHKPARIEERRGRNWYESL